MTRHTVGVSEELNEYLLAVSVRENHILRRLRDRMRDHPRASMQIAPEQGQLMALLARLVNAVNCIEIGVFTGYSALWTALALPDHGRLIACDINEEWTNVAKEYWEEAGVSHKIDLRLAPALETLDSLIAAGRSGEFDFVFIDADKESYVKYFERSLQLCRPGGLITVDNVLWNGDVVNADSQDADTRAIRAFNEKLHHDERIDLSLLPIADGLTLARKR